MKENEEDWQAKPTCAGNWFYRNPSDPPGAFSLVMVVQVAGFDDAKEGAWYGPIKEFPVVPINYGFPPDIIEQHRASSE
jgi:hypothetical protein